jgi:hypothetical protein
MTDPHPTPLGVFVHAVVDTGDLLHQVLARMDDAPLSRQILAELVEELLEPVLAGADDDDLLAASSLLLTAADAVEDGLFCVPPLPAPCSGRVRRGNRRGHR